MQLFRVPIRAHSCSKSKKSSSVDYQLVRLKVSSNFILTRVDTIRRYFQQYGVIDDLVIMVDRDSKPRGFGFVTFAQANTVDKVLSRSLHIIDNKQVECKRAVPKESSIVKGKGNSKILETQQIQKLAPFQPA